MKLDLRDLTNAQLQIRPNGSTGLLPLTNTDVRARLTPFDFVLRNQNANVLLRDAPFASFTSNGGGVGLTMDSEDELPVDGLMGNDLVLITLSQPLPLHEIFFRGWDDDDDFVFFFSPDFVDVGDTFPLAQFQAVQNAPPGGRASFLVDGSPEVRSLGIGALGNDDEFRIEHLVFGTKDPNPDPEVIPVPPAIAMLATGIALIGGFGAVRRRTPKA
ncbi:MAG: hypothetical protein AAGG09_21710 [Pseudomonadota bacterium]